MRARGPFRAELPKLLAETDYVTQGGRPNYSAFARDLDGIHYETLRRVVRGEAPVSLALIEETARLLGIHRNYFRETAVLEAALALDPRHHLDLDEIAEPDEDLPPISAEAALAIDAIVRGRLKSTDDAGNSLSRRRRAS